MSDYRSGGNYIICDECGFKIRASESRKRWDGLRVCQADYEPRHPQDFVRGRHDKQRADVTRPEPADVFVEPATLLSDDATPLQTDSYAEMTVD